MTLCYNCRKPGHLGRQYYEVGPIFLCCKVIGHKVEDCLKIIAKVEKNDKVRENTIWNHITSSMSNNHEGHKEHRSK